VPVGQTKKVKRLNQLAQTGKRLPGRKSPMNRKIGIVHGTPDVRTIACAGHIIAVVRFFGKA
jgi:hypothetical protein